ncbi:squalene--hopene cyclase [Falsibacillus pallidus]|uniref:squalene--hopene cyclase n=1 Tax=Falsibacillus pallidus TaxID=493781 RepID=UPI003D976D41
MIAELVDMEIEKLVLKLMEDQTGNGSWEYPFETGIITDAYMIILLLSLEVPERDLILSLSERIKSRQHPNGAWKLFHDEPEGNLSLTIDAYYALLASGNSKVHDPHMIKAQKFIIQKGGIKEAKLYTKLFLAMTGNYKWPAYFPLPPEFLLLPPSFPLNFFDISVFGRSNLAPLSIIAASKFQLPKGQLPSLDHLNIRNENNEEWQDFRSKEWISLSSAIQKGVKALSGLPHTLRHKGIERAVEYMLGRIEEDGTLLNYFSSTFYMIFALLSIGHPKEHQVISKAVEGLKSMSCQINGYTHIQYTTANVWNTGLICHAFTLAGVAEDNESLLKGVHYLLSQQQTKKGDWALHNEKGNPGGWGFSHGNSMNPDVDDTTASLRSIIPYVSLDSYCAKSWQRGMKWTLSMQNEDGGWPAFEKDMNNPLLSLIPMEGAEFILLDPSTPDLTGRTLEFLGNYTYSVKPSQRMQKGIKWLMENQETDGSWYGRWGICYIYGTWAALTGLSAAGHSPLEPAIRKSLSWLKSIQNEDGGWGESCLSDIKKAYVPLGESTLTHTAWALDALIAFHSEPTKEIEDGIHYLLRSMEKKDWTTDYPKGQGMASFFYIHYHSYRYVFPLITLVHYKKKFIEK